MDGNINYSEKYDIFLSYRRDGGEAMAVLLRDRLSAKGYKVFLDIENLNAGAFNAQLLGVIDGCKDFILVGSQNSLDRCNNDGDWVRLEIARAFEKGKNIVPVLLRGFEFPDELPKEIEAIRMCNGINANNNEYFDAAIDRLAEKFLTAEPLIALPEMTERLNELIYKNVRKKKRKPLLPLIAVICTVALIAAFLLFNKGEQKEITIYNHTPDTIQSICFKRSDTAQWGGNIAVTPLYPNESITVHFPLNETELGITWDMRNIFYLGDINKTFTMEGFTMYELNDIIIYVDTDGEYEREFIRGEQPE